MHTFGQVRAEGDALCASGENADLWIWFTQPETWTWSVRPGHVDARENACNTLVVTVQANAPEVTITSVLVPVRKGERPPSLYMDDGDIEITLLDATHRARVTADRLSVIGGSS